MLVPVALLILILIAVLIGGIYTAKRRFVDHEVAPDIRPDEHMPISHPDLTNPPIEQPNATRVQYEHRGGPGAP